MTRTGILMTLLPPIRASPRHILRLFGTLGGATMRLVHSISQRQRLHSCLSLLPEKPLANVSRYRRRFLLFAAQLSTRPAPTQTRTLPLKMTVPLKHSADSPPRADKETRARVYTKTTSPTRPTMPTTALPGATGRARSTMSQTLPAASTVTRTLARSGR